MIHHDPRRDIYLMTKSLRSAAALFAHIRKRDLFIFGLMAACLFVSMGATAAEYNSGLDGILGNYKGLTNTWYTQIKAYAERLFWLLVLVDFGWTAVIYALEKGDIGEIAVSMVKKLFTIGFFWALLKLSDTWIPAIIDSFSRIGTDVGGVAAASATPDGIVVLGWQYAESAFKALNDLSLADTIGAVVPVALVALLIFMCFLFVSLTLMITLLESYLVIGAGIILLGFGGSRWTTDFATKYLQHAVGTGLKLMLIYLLIGAAANLFQNVEIDPDFLIRSLFSLLGTAAAYAYFVIKVPQIASAMMSGSPALTTGDAMGTALAVGAAIAGVGAAGMAMGGAAAGAATNGAAGLTGLGKALGAGASSGLDVGKSGLGAAAHAVGEVAKHGLGLGASAVGSAVGGAKTAFAERVDSSTGGKIASSIEATRGGNMSGVGVPSGGQGTSGSDSGGADASSSGAAPSGTPSEAPAASGTSAQATDSGSAAPGGATTSTAAATTGPTGSSTAGAAPSGAGGSPSSADGSRVASSGAKAPTGSAVPAGGSEAGDASTAAVSGPSEARNERPRRSEPVSQRIQGLQGYVPQDMAGGATIGIDVKHTQD